MAYERNDIVNKTRLAGELGEELMGFEHNDIVTVDVMNEAIEGGGGGGSVETAQVTIVNTTQDVLTITLAHFEENTLGASLTVFGNDTATKSVPVLTSDGTVGSDLDEHEASTVTGDVELGPYGVFIVHGDGSVTF